MFYGFKILAKHVMARNEAISELCRS